MKQTFKLKLVFFLLIGFTSYSVEAQSKITGKIVGANKKAIIGADIIIKGTTQGTTTNLSGNFTLISNLSFPWTLVVSYTGYGTKEIIVDSNSSLVNIILEEKASLLDEVIISASRKSEKITESLASVSVVNAKNIKSQPTEVESLNLIKNVQGVRLINNGVAKVNVSLRGQALVNETQTLVLKDYRSMQNPHTTIIDNERMGVNPLDIERIEIVRGPSGALWGPGVNSGVVHFITKDPFKHPGTSVSTSYSVEGQNIKKINFRYAENNGKWGYKIVYGHRSGDDFVYDSSIPEDIVTAANVLNNDGPPGLGRDGIIQPLIGGADIQLPFLLDANGNRIPHPTRSGEFVYNMIPDFHSNTIEASIEYKPNKDLKIAIAPQYGESEINFRNAATPTRDWGNIFTIQGRVNYKQFFASLNYFKAFGWDGNNGSTARGNRSAALIATSIDTRGDINVYDFASQLPFKGGEKWNFVTGLDVKLLRFDGATVSGFPSRHGRFDADDNFDVIGGYFQATYKPNDQLMLNAVMRVDKFSIYGSSLSPKLGLIYNPDKDKNHSLRVSLSRSYRAPSPILTNFDTRLAGKNLMGVRESQTFTNTVLYHGNVAPPLADPTPFNTETPTLQSILERINPTLASAYNLMGNATSTITDPLTGTRFNKVSDQFIRKAELEFTDGFEIGYTGVSEDQRFQYTIDAFYQRQTNMLDNVSEIGPVVNFNNIVQELTDALTAAGASAAEIASIQAAASEFAGRDYKAYSDQVIAGIAQGFQDARGLGNTGIRTYQGSAKYFGIEASLKYTTEKGYVPFATFSWLSDTVFDTKELGDDPASGRVYYLNTPPFRARFGINKIISDERGFYGSIVGRYDAAFRARDGIWNGNVDDYFLVDVSLGYKFNNSLTLDVSTTNLTNVIYRPLPNIPAQRRLVFLTITHDLVK